VGAAANYSNASSAPPRIRAALAFRRQAAKVVLTAAVTRGNVQLKRLAVDDRISERDARELVFYFIRWGDHGDNSLRYLTDAAVEAELRSRGYRLADVVTELQTNPHKLVTKFENLLEAGLSEISADAGSQVRHSFIVSGVEIDVREINQHGVVRLPHRADFVAACEARDRAIAESSFDHFYTALAKGFASLEGYFNLRVAVYNAKHNPSDRLQEKRKGGFVSFGEKVREWLPKLTGKSIDFGNSPGWQNFLYLRDVRNEVVIHPKPGAGFTTLDELAEGINRFRSGVGSLMFSLLQAFEDPIQRSVIRAMRYPLVRVIPNTDDVGRRGTRPA
jgi:hypothetical protein